MREGPRPASWHSDRFFGQAAFSLTAGREIGEADTLLFHSAPSNTLVARAARMVQTKASGGYDPW